MTFSRKPTTHSVIDLWLVLFNYHHSVYSVALALNFDTLGPQLQPQNLSYVVAGLAARALALVAIAIVS